MGLGPAEDVVHIRPGPNPVPKPKAKEEGWQQKDGECAEQRVDSEHEYPVLQAVLRAGPRKSDRGSGAEAEQRLRKLIRLHQLRLELDGRQAAGQEKAASYERSRQNSRTKQEASGKTAREKEGRKE